MKPGNLITKVVMWAFFVSIAAYFAFYASHVLFHSYETAELYTYSAEDAAEANSYLFRQETVLDGSSELEEVVPGEGETVGVGDTLAIRYADQEALDRSRELTALRSRLESLKYILAHASDGSDNATLNQAIVDTMTDLRIMVSKGDLSGLDTQSARLKNLMFRRDYTYNGSSALSEEINSVSKEIKALETENSSSTEKITAQISGVFSGVVDGYEDVLTTEAVSRLTVSQLHELANQQKELEEVPLGKIITDATWYCAAELKKEDAENLYEGGTATARFNGFDWTLDMKVESVSKAENGMVCVVLSSDRYLSEITTLRNQVIDIIFKTVTGYRVDKSAIYVDSSSGQSGVYRLYGSQAVWVNVDLLWEGEDYYLIRQTPEYDEEGNEVSLTTLEEAKQLRAGAEIIVSGTDLYDGKVME